MPLYRAPLLGICSRGCEQAQDGAGGGGDYIRGEKKIFHKARHTPKSCRTAPEPQNCRHSTGAYSGGGGRGGERGREGGPTLNSVKAHTARS